MIATHFNVRTVRGHAFVHMESRKASVKYVVDQMFAPINESKIIVWSVMDQVFVITTNDGAAAKYVRVVVFALIKN